MPDTARTALIAGIFTLLGAIGGAAVTGWSQVELAKQKFNSDLVLKALESNSPNERLESLKLIVATKLLKDTEVQRAVEEYAQKKQSNPSTIPQITSSAQFEPPPKPNSRVYLLTGNKSKEILFPAYRQELESVGYQVLGAKFLIDPGRPTSEEVRYFYKEDQVQAEKIAEVVGFKLSKPQIKANYYSDSSVNPGYIEIWFGK